MIKKLIREGVDILLIMSVCVVLLLMAGNAHCDELTRNTRYTLEQTRSGLEAVKATKGDIAKGADFDNLALEFFMAQERWGIPSLFLVSIGWHESRYGMDRIGPIGELGVMQVAPMGRKR